MQIFYMSSTFTSHTLPLPGGVMSIETQQKVYEKVLNHQDVAGARGRVI